ncbi:MAG: copper-binding protein [Pseudomonadota bacterium]
MKRSKLVLLAGLLAVPGLAIAQGDMERQPDSDMPGMETSPSQVSAQMFKNKDNFDLEGTVSSVDPTQRQITIQREGMPSVELQVASDTEVKVNGEESSLSQIQPGDEVRTEFNLAQDQAIAVKVEAKESKERRSRERREGERTRGY